MADPELVKRMARNFAAEWLRPSDPDHANPTLLDKLSTVMVAFYAVTSQAVERRSVARPTSPDNTMDIYVPGNWTCPKCAFGLSSLTIFMGSGEIGCTRDQVMQMTGELCPNDGEPMRRTTWRERAADNQKWGESLMEDIIAATGAEHLPGALAAIKERFSGNR